MIIEVQSNGTVTLTEVADLKRFAITGGRPDPAVAETLAAAGLELTADMGHGFVAPHTVKAWAAGVSDVPEGWLADFDAMVAYATSKGWTDEAGRLRAHTEWSP